MRSLASAENAVVRKGVSRTSLSFLGTAEDGNLEDAKHAIVRSLLRNSGRIIFHSFCLKSLIRF